MVQVRILAAEHDTSSPESHEGQTDTHDGSRTVTAVNSSATGTTRVRMTWMDALRGVAIALVILWHSAAILERFDYEVPGALLWINEIFAPYRMPTLMFLSGMLLGASLRKPLGTYYLGKLRHIAWPLLLWNTLHFFQLHPVKTWWGPALWVTSYLWFLSYILIYYLVSPLLKWIPPAVFAVLALALTFVPDDQNQRRFFFLAVFFLLGHLAARRRDVLDRWVRSSGVWIAGAVAVGFGAGSAVWGPYRYLGWSIPFSVAGILALVRLAQISAPRSWSLPVQYVGRHSIIYYVTHFPVILVVVDLDRDHWNLPSGLVVGVGFVIAGGVGTAAAWLSDRTPLSYLFTFPGSGSGARTVGTLPKP